MKDKEYNITHNDLGRWANIRLAFIKQHPAPLAAVPRSTERK
ncbi:hypothetical protein [Gemmiger sp.]